MHSLKVWHLTFERCMHDVIDVNFQISAEKAQAKAAKYDFKPRYYSIVGALLDAASKAEVDQPEPVGFIHW